MNHPSALVLFSGGQDSTTCLAWALNRYTRVETIGFDYGQRHRVELECRQTIRERLTALKPAWGGRLSDDHVLDLGILGQVSDTALTGDAEIRMQANGLPNTFVPGRNILFLTFAATLAYRRDLGTIIGGMCETDFSGYPDCRDEAIKATGLAVNLGMDSHFHFETPLMWLDKADSWSLAEAEGGQALVELIVKETHTCYLGTRGTPHDWGHGCGTCPACEIRARGWRQYQGLPIDDGDAAVKR